MEHTTSDLAGVSVWDHLQFFLCSPLALTAEGATAFSPAPTAEFSGLQIALQPLLSVSRVLSRCTVQKYFVSIFINKEMLSGRKKNTKDNKRSEGFAISVGLGRPAESLFEGSYHIPGGGRAEGMLY